MRVTFRSRRMRSQFLSSLVGSLPPLQEIAKMAGVELPEYLGRMVETKSNGASTPAP